MPPQISILLPTHNKADLLKFAIHSILAQTFQDFEVLIVGDGCTDHTAQVIEEFNDPRLIWFDLPKAPNFGYANRNFVLRQARGDLIAFMAHDDLWMTDHLEGLIPLFDDKRIEIAYSQPLWVIPKGMLAPGYFNIEEPSTLAFYMERGSRIPAACFMHRKDCLEKYGYWNDQLSKGADYDMWKRIIKGGGYDNFAYLDHPTCLHFKAGWHNKSYDRSHHIPSWVRLFKSGQMPQTLRIPISDEVSEQEAVWRVISINPKEWNDAVRSSIRQVTDLLAYKGLIDAPKSLDLRKIKKTLLQRISDFLYGLFLRT